jgi:hypothetical protein
MSILSIIALFGTGHRISCEIQVLLHILCGMPAACTDIMGRVGLGLLMSHLQHVDAGMCRYVYSLSLIAHALSFKQKTNHI